MCTECLDSLSAMKEMYFICLFLEFQLFIQIPVNIQCNISFRCRIYIQHPVHSLIPITHLTHLPAHLPSVNLFSIVECLFPHFPLFSPLCFSVLFLKFHI